MSVDHNDDSEDEFIVYAEFVEGVDITQYENINVLGIDTKNPVIQMDDTFFTGQYELPLGTYMFFEHDHNAKSADPLFHKFPEKNVKYLCKTRKLINMEHAYVTPNEPMEDNKKTGEKNPDTEIETVRFNNLQQGLEKFKTYWETIEKEATEGASTTTENEAQPT